MAKKTVDYKKVGLTFVAFAAAKFLFDFLTKDTIDFYGVFFIPLITIGLILLVDKDRLMSQD